MQKICSGLLNSLEMWAQKLLREEEESKNSDPEKDETHEIINEVTEKLSKEAIVEVLKICKKRKAPDKYGWKS